MNRSCFNIPLCIIFFIWMNLTGCEEREDYAYLVHHPLVLKQRLARCQQEVLHQVAPCEVVFYAAANLTALAEEQQADPQQFGDRILRAQVAAMAAKKTLARAQKEFDQYEKKQASAGRQRAQEKLDEARQVYQAQRACQYRNNVNDDKGVVARYSKHDRAVPQ
jgi:hypothetical protein